MRRTVALSLLLLIASVATQATVAPGRITGVVMSDGESPNRPVRHAIVTLTGGGAGPVQTSTDDEGRFAFSNLTAGRFTLTAEKPAYVKTYYGSKRPGRPPGSPIALADGQTVDLRIPLVRGAVITGTVRDELGNPVPSAQLHALQPTFVNGERRLVEGLVDLAVSDDRGMYRFYGLPPGEYTVQSNAGGAGGIELHEMTSAEYDSIQREAQGRPGETRSPAASPTNAATVTLSRGSVYYPGTREAAQAQTFTLAAGEERSGVDLTTSWVRTGRVTGTALGPDGAPLTNIIVGLASLNRGSLWMSPGFIRTNASGQFTISLGPGRWAFFGRGSDQPGDMATMPYFTTTEFTVTSEQLDGVIMQFDRGVSVSGRVVFDGTSPKPASARISLVTLPIVPGASLGSAPATLASDGTFTIASVPNGRYRLSVVVPAPWSLRSAIAGSQDILDVPLEISGQTVSDLAVHVVDRATEVTGTLVDQLGRPAPEYSIVIFPADKTLRQTAPRRTSGAVKLATDGSFHVVGLPPGEYLLAALTDVDPSQLNDPSFLEQLASAAVAFTLAEGEKKTQTLRLGGG